MKEEAWKDSAFRSWGIRFRFQNPRVDLLENCQIEGDCWLSVAATVGVGPKTVSVQRAAYILFEGPLAPGDRVESTCGNRRCCWGGHLKARVRSDNRETSIKRYETGVCASALGTTHERTP